MNIHRQSDIRRRLSRLERKYQTRNPFELAQCLGIVVLYEELGGIRGYYNKQLRIKMIHINYELSPHDQLFTCAHELGHALLHPDANTQFLRSETLLSVDKLEIEANKFAIELLITDSALKDYQYLTEEQLARLYAYHVGLIKLRIRGCHVVNSKEYYREKNEE